MNKKQIIISALLAGVCIGIGGTAFLMLDNKVLGSCLFTIGLFCICTMGLHLFTGKVCYLFDNPPSYLLDLALVWVGNLLGTGLMGTLLRQTRIAAVIVPKAQSLAEIKLGDSIPSIFILAILCNILIYIGVEGYKSIPHEVGKYLALFLGIMVFILSGYEHCVANMFYFTVAGAWSGKAILYLLIMTAGNAVGGLSFPVLRRLLK